MTERKESQHPHPSLGQWPKKIEISAEEMHLAYRHREITGEPIQTWVRRLIRENWEVKSHVT